MIYPERAGRLDTDFKPTPDETRQFRKEARGRERRATRRRGLGRVAQMAIFAADALVYRMTPTDAQGRTVETPKRSTPARRGHPALR